MIDDNSLNSKQIVNKFLFIKYSEYWKSRIMNESKLRTYITFKADFGMEDYLTISNDKHRKAMARFRISAHTLAIERGRYTTPPTPLIDRVCKHCADHRIEDEFHFLVECDKYDSPRRKLFHEIGILCPRFQDLNDKQKFVYMLGAGVDVSHHVSLFIHDNIP
jgi:hypothetical protein